MDCETLLPHFQRDCEGRGRYLRFRVDGNWTAQGHCLAAQVICDHSKRQEWLP